MYAFIDLVSALSVIVNNHLSKAGTMNILFSQDAKSASVNISNHLERNNTSNDLLTHPFSGDNSHECHLVLYFFYSIEQSVTIHHLANFS